MTKLPLLFGTQRSGSNLVYHALAEHLEREHGVLGLGEYFDFNYQSFWDDGSGIKVSVFPSLRARAHVIPLEMTATVWRQRVEWLQRYPGRYFFKIQSNAAPLEHFDWLRETYQWVLIERRNLLNQLLSFLISMSTGRWYEDSGLNIPRGSIRADATHIRLFKRMIYDYIMLKNQLKDPTVLVYEDLTALADPGDEIIRRCGLPRRVNEPLLRRTPRQNPENKLPLFTNPHLILEMYVGCGLQFLAPLESCLPGIPIKGRAGPTSASRRARDSRPLR